MADGRRARAEQVARRVNTAAEFLDEGMEVIDATRALARRYRLSERQARRYVERARDEGAMEVPGRKVSSRSSCPLRWPAVFVEPLGRAAGASPRLSARRCRSSWTVIMAGPAERKVAVEFVFDRSGEQGLVQAYRILCPSARREPHKGRRHLTATR